ncbi:MAG TPA: TerB family tellurite resistance protein, partial [Burkholderiaceae bacterium]|nr:TerB family tellurite resistance protein [Burkholderiaceae bacterium]
MTASETRAILTVSLLAVFADGDKHERERDEIKRIAEGLSQTDAVHLPTLYQDVLMKRVTLTTALPALQSSASRQLAYEMAACVCDADGAQSPAEQAFLAELGSALGIGAASATQFSGQAEALATVPLAAAGAAVPHAELDAEILNAAILNGALELLPETLSTMAIIPLQMKLVYRIGKAHGYELDSGHVKD